MKTFSWDTMEQLAFDLDVDEIDADGQSISAEEIARRSAHALQVIETRDWSVDGKEAPNWLLDFFRLRRMYKNWRVACYIAWAASPKEGRWPATQEELATQVLGLTSDRQISTWRKKYPRIEDAISLLQSAPLFESRSDRFRALAQAAIKAGDDYKFYRYLELSFKMDGEFVPRAKIGPDVPGTIADLNDLTDAELDRLSAHLLGDGGELEIEDGDTDDAGDNADI